MTNSLLNLKAWAHWKLLDDTDQELAQDVLNALETIEQLKDKLRQIEEMLTKAPIVYGILEPASEDYSAWDTTKMSKDSHRARLVMIEPIGDDK